MTRGLLTLDREPREDVEHEATRILDAARNEDVTVRLLGGVAIAALAQGRLPPALQRSYADIDLAIKPNTGMKATALLESLGYQPDRSFNGLHGHRRLLFHDQLNARQVDVFVGVFRMCHELDLTQRLETLPDTLTPADLLLTKLQIVELNQKDVVDAASLLYLCDVGTRPEPAIIDLPRLTAVTSGDWGWFTTATDNLGRVAVARLSVAEADTVSTRANLIAAAIRDAPKSMAWRLRARIGRRMQWYELPDEVGNG